MSCSNRTYYFETHESIQISFTTWLCIVGTPMLVMIGVSGNFVSFLIFRKRALRSASHFYFCALVVADSLTLVFGFLVEAWLREYVKEGVLKRAFLRLHAAQQANDTAAASAAALDYLPIGAYSYLCLPSVFLRTASQTASVYLLITFTATRTLVIVHPLQSAVWATVSTAKKCVAVVVGGSMLIATCTTAYHAFARLCDPLVASDILDLVFLSFVPSIALLVFNCVIVCTIYQREQLAGSGRRMLHVGGITRRLILVTVAFILLEMPLSVCKVYIHLNGLECLPHGYFLRCRQPSFSLIRRALKQPPTASRRCVHSLPPLATPHQLRVGDVSPFLANVQTIDAEMQLELEPDEIEYFNIAVEHAHLRTRSWLRRYASLPAFVRFDLPLPEPCWKEPVSDACRPHPRPRSRSFSAQANSGALSP